MPKILKMPKPAPKAEREKENGKVEHPTPCSKTTAMAEIILFPNGNDEIPFIPGPTDPDTKMRWLRLADDVLDGKCKRKKA